MQVSSHQQAKQCIVINLCFVLHQAAAKQNRSNVEQEPSLQDQGSTSVASPDVTHYTPQGITECVSSSEESLKEITPPPTTPRVTIQQPAGISMASTTQPHTGILSDQYGDDTSSARAGPSRIPTVTFEDEAEELVPSPRRKKKKKPRGSEGMNTETLNNGGYELAAVNAKGSAHVGQDNVDAAAPRRKKKKVKATAPESLPPVVVRRPLPQLQLQEDN